MVLIKHIMVPYSPSEAFYRAFKKSLDMAKQNHAKLTLVKTISYPAGMGLDMTVVMNSASSEHTIQEFGKILPNLQNEAFLAKVDFHFEIIDTQSSSANAIVEFASKNNVDLMILSGIQKGWKKYLTSDISQEIINLNPPCSVILAE